MKSLTYAIVWAWHYGLRRPFVKCVLVPFWWLEGLMISPNLAGARRHRRMAEMLYWTARL